MRRLMAEAISAERVRKEIFWLSNTADGGTSYRCWLGDKSGEKQAGHWDLAAAAVQRTRRRKRGPKWPHRSIGFSGSREHGCRRRFAGDVRELSLWTVPAAR